MALMPPNINNKATTEMAAPSKKSVSIVATPAKDVNSPIKNFMVYLLSLIEDAFILFMGVIIQYLPKMSNETFL
jgi:uncharacterized membrane protein